MNETWAALFGAMVGATAAVIGTVLAAYLQARSEQRKWIRDQMRQIYSETLRTLSRTLVVPIGADTTKLETWYRGLATLREHPVSMQVYCDQMNESLTR